MESVSEFKLRDMFVCDFCRQICKGGCNEDLVRLEKGIIDDTNRDLIGFRKQRIKCLGEFCDKPCELNQKEAILDSKILVNAIMYLGNKVNQLIKEK